MSIALVTRGMIAPSSGGSEDVTVFVPQPTARVTVKVQAPAMFRIRVET